MPLSTRLSNTITFTSAQLEALQVRDSGSCACFHALCDHQLKLANSGLSFFSLSLSLLFSSNHARDRDIHGSLTIVIVIIAGNYSSNFLIAANQDGSRCLVDSSCATLLSLACSSSWNIRRALRWSPTVLVVKARYFERKTSANTMALRRCPPNWRANGSDNEWKPLIGPRFIIPRIEYACMCLRTNESERSTKCTRARG